MSAILIKLRLSRVQNSKLVNYIVVSGEMLRNQEGGKRREAGSAYWVTCSRQITWSVQRRPHCSWCLAFALLPGPERLDDLYDILVPTLLFPFPILCSESCPWALTWHSDSGWHVGSHFYDHQSHREPQPSAACLWDNPNILCWRLLVLSQVLSQSLHVILWPPSWISSQNLLWLFF